MNQAKTQKSGGTKKIWRFEELISRNSAKEEGASDNLGMTVIYCHFGQTSEIKVYIKILSF